LNKTPVSNRLHISIFGRRNVGKSTLINALTNQEIAVVSNIPGTTTDPVFKTMELLPIGPVVIIDTAGLDDSGELGELRIKKTYDILRKTDLAILVINSRDGYTIFEEKLLEIIKEREIMCIIVINNFDNEKIRREDIEKIKLNGYPYEEINAKNFEGIENLKNLIGDYAKVEENNNIVGDLINPGDFVILVTPIDKAAPKGRLILPQQQTVRDIIDNDAIAIVAKENELKQTIEGLNKKPSLVITDSQAFSIVSKDTPIDIKLTSFSILIARQKGDLFELVKGVSCINKLKSGSKVLIVEGCTHHRQEDDIGKVKIPKWIRQFSGGEIEFNWASGVYFPEEINEYDLIVHCGGCMLNRREMMYRIDTSKRKNVHITNYGMLIAYTHGILERALEPFPDVLRLIDEN